MTFVNRTWVLQLLIKLVAATTELHYMSQTYVASQQNLDVHNSKNLKGGNQVSLATLNVMYAGELLYLQPLGSICACYHYHMIYYVIIYMHM